MIISQLSGGLGNQMFQAAAGYTLSRDRNTSFRVDLSCFKNNPRIFALGCFKNQFNEITPEEFFLSNHPSIKYKFKNWFSRNRSQAKVSRFLEKCPFEYDDRIQLVSDDIYLIGYYQTERYFVNRADEVRVLFEFKQEVLGINAEFLSQIKAKNSVFIHVRRGDYVSNPIANQFHGTCGIDYYFRAIELIKEKVKEPVFYIFSDDYEWAKENIKPPGPTVYITGNQGDYKSYEDLRLMSFCKHAIIANSSFSWWGAWLIKNADKTVIAPKKWVHDEKTIVRDLIPENWIRI